jgi:hypothetical protein
MSALDLRDNNDVVSERVFLALAESLPEIKVLQRVDFSCCSGLPSAVPLVLAGLRQNSSLFPFHVTNCAISSVPPTPEEWAKCAGGSSIRLKDPPEDPTLGGRIQEFRSKLLPFASTDRETIQDRAELMRELGTFTVATQGLISTLSNIDKDRQENLRENLAEKSVLRNLGQP